MKVHPSCLLLSPARVRENVLLNNVAGKRLDRSPGMLLLARVNDRPRSQLAKHPVHSAELCRGHGEREPSFVDQSVDSKFTPRLLTVIKYEISYYPRLEVGDGSDFHPAILQHLPVNDLVPLFRIRRESVRRSAWSCTARQSWHVLRIIIRSHPNQSEVHNETSGNRAQDFG